MLLRKVDNFLQDYRVNNPEDYTLNSEADFSIIHYSTELN
jgi:hypothetical protein